MIKIRLFKLAIDNSGRLNGYWHVFIEKMKTFLLPNGKTMVSGYTFTKVKHT
jgi:hypothetical protein